jgi:multidrug efflux pump subunit AcrB
VRVAIDLGRLAQLRIPVTQVLQSIQSEDAKSPAGASMPAAASSTSRRAGAIRRSEVRQTVVAAVAGDGRLQDVATVE